jgi:two-component system alkaline phosphatase synthesis response regulator PhoP
MNNKTILIVDDEASVRSVVRKTLGDQYIVIEAKDGAAALDAIRTQRPDLILMDIMMPKMDGYKAAYTIKKNEETKGIPVVMLTGLGFELNKKLAESMGADGYMVKPFSPGQLRELVGQFLKNHDL